MSPLTFIISLWMSTASIVLVILTLYRIEDKPNGLSFLGYPDGKLLIVAMIALLCSWAMAVCYGIRLRKTGKRPFSNSPHLECSTAVSRSRCSRDHPELIVTETPMATLFLGEPLLLQSLKAVVDNYRIDSFLSFDQTLGWVVRPNLSTTVGLYYPSVEGLRTSKANTQFNAESAACRIALVGDSHTFGEELKFEETWGYLLQTHLPECQILNFGTSLLVDGSWSDGDIFTTLISSVYMRPETPSGGANRMEIHSKFLITPYYAPSSMWLNPTNPFR